MKLIAHRGLTDGPDLALENHPSNIQKTLSQGFDAEIDVRYIDNKWYLGHDTATYEIAYDFLLQPGLWLHAKNLEALCMFTADYKLNFFWHQNDDFTLTSQGFIWTYPNKELTPKSICVLPEWNDPKFDNLPTECFGICSKFVHKIHK